MDAWQKEISKIPIHRQVDSHRVLPLALTTGAASVLLISAATTCRAPIEVLVTVGVALALMTIHTIRVEIRRDRHLADIRADLAGIRADIASLSTERAMDGYLLAVADREQRHH